MKEIFHALTSDYFDTVLSPLLDRLTAGILLVNDAGKVRLSNPAASRMLGIPGNKLFDQDFLPLIHAAVQENGLPYLFPDPLKPICQESQDSIIGIPDAEGRMKWLSVIFSHLPEECNSLPGHLMISFTDISETKKAELRFKESEIRFRTFLDNQPGSAWITDENGYMIYMNKQYRDTWHLKEEDCCKHITEFVPKELVKEYLDNNQQVLDGNKTIVTFEKTIRKDGSRGISLVYKFPIPGASSPRLIGGQSIDITDERNAEGIIQKTNERFYYVTKATSDSIWDLNIETGQIFRSESFFTLTGYSPNEIENNLDWWYRKTHPDDREQTLHKFQQSISQNRQQWQAEYRFLCADQQYRHFSDKGFIIYDQGKPVRAIGAIQDLTEIKILERKLRDQDSQKRKQISQAVIAAQDQERNEIGKELHDNINQMLSTVRLLLSTIKTRNLTNNHIFIQCKDYLNLAIEEIRIQSKSLSSSFVREVGLKAAIQDIAKNMALTRMIKTDVDYNDSLEERLLPEQKLMVCRIIQEQTNNIIKHAEACEVQISVQEKEGYLQLLISDNGKGFDLNQTPGGVGLTNIRNRVEVFNGTLSIDTEPGKGCAMHISIPLA
mgnify:CR=1 FL=1